MTGLRLSFGSEQASLTSVAPPAMSTLARPDAAPLTLSFGEPQARSGDRVDVAVYLEGNTSDLTAIALQVRVKALSTSLVQFARVGATADRQAIFHASPR